MHHAEAAGDDAALAAAALPAARQAAAAGANREALAHYRRAVRLADRLAAAERPRVTEELAGVAYLVGRTGEALEAVGAAEDGYRAWATSRRSAAARGCAHACTGTPATAPPPGRRRSARSPSWSRWGSRASSPGLQRGRAARDAGRPMGETRAWGRRAADLAERLADPATRRTPW